MREWKRSTGRHERCGFCGRPLAFNDAHLVLTIRGLKDPKRRCAACAGEPVPADLAAPAIGTDASVTSPPAAAAAATIDVKQRQVGRED